MEILREASRVMRMRTQRSIPLYCVFNSRELEIGQQAWEVVLDGLEIGLAEDVFRKLEARVFVYCIDPEDEPPGVVHIYLGGPVDNDGFNLKPSETGFLKIAGINAEKIEFEPITLPRGEEVIILLEWDYEDHE